MLVFFLANIFPWIVIIMMLIGFIGYLKYYKEIDIVLDSIVEAIVYNKKINWKEVFPYTWPLLTMSTSYATAWLMRNIEKFL